MLHIDHWLTAYLAAIAAIIGAAGGSFVNCLAWRTVHGEKITGGRSHCTQCGHVLGVLDLIPVFGWLFRRGRCRYCGERISPRYLAAELFMTGVSLCLLFRFDVSVPYVFVLGFAFLLLAVGLVDLESYEIPDRFLAAAFLWWCLFLPAHRADLAAYLLDGAAGGFFIGGGLFAVSLVFDRILGRDSLGGGDIKLFFVTGLYLGLAVNLLNLIISCILGLVLAGVLAASERRKEKKQTGKMAKEETEGTAADRGNGSEPGQIPFGPAIALSTLVCLLAGREITGWYLSLF